jgi:hydroxymethylpyrimidine/phosphomethylpyrimidine kinase
MYTALTIAGSDPTSGAGLQADLKTFSALGIYGVSIPAVLTAQNTEGVFEIQEVPADFFSCQIDILLKDIRPDALKTGMLYTPDNVRIVSEKIRRHSLHNLVIDPLMKASKGIMLAGGDMDKAMKKFLFPLAKVITPNLYEASVLTAIDIQSDKDAKEAAVILRSFGPGAVIITGGHMKNTAIDLLFDGEEFLALESEKLEGEYHGTGCTFSAVITACLAAGYSVKESFIRAKDFVHSSMKSARTIGKGMKILQYKYETE